MLAEQLFKMHRYVDPSTFQTGQRFELVSGSQILDDMNPQPLTQMIPLVLSRINGPDQIGLLPLHPTFVPSFLLIPFLPLLPELAGQFPSRKTSLMPLVEFSGTTGTFQAMTERLDFQGHLRQGKISQLFRPRFFQ
jgi:hypothetical protein